MTRHFKVDWKESKYFAGASLKSDRTASVILGLLFVFIGMSWLAFSPSYIHSFLTDDYKQLSFIQLFIDQPYKIYQAFNPYFLGWYYRPTQLVYFTGFRLLFGVNPLPYYVGLLLLHAINIALVYKVARIWGNGRLGAICAAGIFSVIVTHQEVVGWISAVSILLAATFSLLTLYNLRKFLNDRQQITYVILALLASVLALLSREETIVLFPLILIICLFSGQRRPAKLEILLFILFGIFVIFYGVIVFLRPTWTPHADATLKLNINNLLSITNLSQFFLIIIGHYLSLENISSNVNGWVLGLMLSLILVMGVAFWRGSKSFRLGVLWTAAILLFLYVVVWLFTGTIAHRYLYLPWIGISLIVGALADHLRQKYPQPLAVPTIILFILIGIICYQTWLGRSRQQKWQNDADITASNMTQIRELVPEINEQTHFFAYNMPPVTDYIQSMAAVWYDTVLDARGGQWNRLLGSGGATPNDHLLNHENGTVYNIMPELQDYEETAFIWQESPRAEIIYLNGMSQPLNMGAYQLDQVVGPQEKKRFGFFLHPPDPKEGWSSLTYTTTVPDNSYLLFGIYKEWGQIDSEDGMMFRVNIIDATGDTQTIYHTSIDTYTEDWIEPKLSMAAYKEQDVLIQFQVYANGNFLHDHAYWANPRFVIESTD